MYLWALLPAQASAATDQDRAGQGRLTTSEHGRGFPPESLQGSAFCHLFPGDGQNSLC